MEEKYKICLYCGTTLYYDNGNPIPSRIRTLARTKYINSDKPKKCIHCGYNKHFEVCHIKGISEFSDKTKLSEINNLDNLIALCPNCHWELDYGDLTMEEILHT